MAVLFRRHVVEVAVGPDGVLRPVPAAPWRSERATGEGELDRRLAALAIASPAAVAAFVSTYGFLRKKTAVLRGQPEPVIREHLQIAGQRGADDVRACIDWVDAGCPEPAPAGALMLVQAAVALPDAALDSMELMANGAPDSEAEAALTFDPWAILPDLMATTFPAAMAAPPALPTSAADRAQLRRKLVVLEWVSRILGGLEETPTALTELGGTVGAAMTFLTTTPEAFAHPELGVEESRRGSEVMVQLVAESVEEWQAAAREFALSGETVDLVIRALQFGLSDPEKARLRKLCLELADGYTPANLAAAELAERAMPLLRVRLEAEMARGGVWPARSGTIAGAYWRALVSLWSRLTDERPPMLCAEQGCPALLSTHASRLYCDSHRRSRHREVERVRRRADRAIARLTSSNG